MRVVLAILGAVLGLALFSADRTWFSVLLGALAGLGIAEGMLLRQRLGQAEKQLGSLAKLVVRLRQQLEEPNRAEPARPAGAAPDAAAAKATAPAASTRPAQPASAQPATLAHAAT